MGVGDPITHKNIRNRAEDIDSEEKLKRRQLKLGGVLLF